MIDLWNFVNKYSEESIEDGYDVFFFRVKLVGTVNAKEFKKLVSESREGEFADVDVFDGKEHSYIELGAWIGDQGMALRLMGLGALLGLWKVLTPRNFPTIPEARQASFAGQGMVSVVPNHLTEKN